MTIATQAPAEDEEVVFNVDAPPDVPPGVYTGTLTSMRPFEYDTPEGEHRKLIEWMFAATLADGESIEVPGVTSLATGPKSKAYGWLVALLGPASVVPNAMIRASQLIGREALVTIGPDKKGWPKVMELTALPITPRRAEAKGDTPSFLTGAGEAGPTPDPAADTRCVEFSVEFGRCTRETGHIANHLGTDKQTWR